MDARRSTGVVTIATFRHRPVAEAKLTWLRTALGPERRRMARLLTSDIPAVDALTDMLVPELVGTARSPGVYAAMDSRLVRAMGQAFLYEVVRRRL